MFLSRHVLLRPAFNASRSFNVRWLSSGSTKFSEYKHLEITNEPNSVLRVAFNRPEVHNAFNTEVMNEVKTLFTDLAEDSGSSRSVVLTGNGKSFSSGADLGYMQTMGQMTEEENRADSLALFDMFYAIRSCPIPVIAMINGPALAGGTGIVSACDIAFAVHRAKFGLTEVRLGLIPAVISKFVMEKIGRAHSSRYFLTGELFDAKEAVKLGLVSEAVETPEELKELVDSVTLQISQNSPNAVKAAKQLVDAVSSASNVIDTRNFVTTEIAKARVSDQGQEGIQAFLEKRKPNWL